MRYSHWFQADVTPGMKDVHATKKKHQHHARPKTLSVHNGGPKTDANAKTRRKKISVADDILNTADDVSSIADQTEEMFTAPMGDDLDPDATENIVTPDDLETPDEIDDSIMESESTTPDRYVI